MISKQSSRLGRTLAYLFVSLFFCGAALVIVQVAWSIIPSYIMPYVQTGEIVDGQLVSSHQLSRSSHKEIYEIQFTAKDGALAKFYSHHKIRKGGKNHFKIGQTLPITITEGGQAYLKPPFSTTFHHSVAMLGLLFFACITALIVCAMLWGAIELMDVEGGRHDKLYFSSIAFVLLLFLIAIISAMCVAYPNSQLSAMLNQSPVIRAHITHVHYLPQESSFYAEYQYINASKEGQVSTGIEKLSTNSVWNSHAEHQRVSLLTSESGKPMIYDFWSLSAFCIYYIFGALAVCIYSIMLRKSLKGIVNAYHS